MNKPMEPILNKTANVDFTELARIFRFGKGQDGYQWGDTRGEEGGYGRETLDRLIRLGYAEKTGAYTPNQLGGAWPEVAVTKTGILAMMQTDVFQASQKYLQENSVQVPVAILDSSWGELLFCIRTGAVLGVDIKMIDPEVRLDDMPARIDVAELAQAYPDDGVLETVYDVLDVGYWSAGGIYVPAEDDFREELKRSRFSSP